MRYSTENVQIVDFVSLGVDFCFMSFDYFVQTDNLRL